MCGSRSDLPSNIADTKLVISKMGNKFFLKNKIFQISCLQNRCDLEVSFCKKTSYCDFVITKDYNQN